MTHAGIDTTTTRSRKPIPAKPRWRPTGTRSAAQQRGASMQGLETCPVASLAEEAAAVLSLNRALREEAADHDVELFGALKAPDDYVRPSEMKEALFDRLKAISELASHRRARSLKGALFQLYLAASHSQNPGGLLRTHLNAGDQQALDRNARRLHYGAIAHLEPLALDEDLIEIRSWYFAPTYDVHHTCDRAMTGRDSLIAEVQAVAARESVARPVT